MIRRKEQGITLIALIVTIIVMLILVTLTVTSAVNGGIFKKAGEAVSKTKDSMKNEQDAVNKLLAEMEKYQSGEGDTPPAEVTPEPTEVKAGEKAKKNLPYKEGGKEVIIPGGFTVSGIPSEQTIAGGLVIYLIPEGETVDWSTEAGKTKAQQSYDQYVWIPVEYTASGNKDEHGLDENFKNVFYRSSWSNNARSTSTLSTNYNEPYTRGYTGESDEYYDMMLSVQDNGGFYIGRYEAGSQDSSGQPKARGNTSNNTTAVVVRRDQYVYNYVGWGSSNSDIDSEISYENNNQGYGAVYLSKHLYEGNKEINGVKSMLTYGVQWDAVLDFVKDDTHDVTTSTNWGNYYDSTYQITRETAKYTTQYSNASPSYSAVPTTNKASSTSWLLTTGASDDFEAKNIYDIAGNVYEWTMEEYSNSSTSFYRVIRGGNFHSTGSGLPASIRNVYDPYDCSFHRGFRPVLYIENV